MFKPIRKKINEIDRTATEASLQSRLCEGLLLYTHTYKCNIM